MSPSFAHVFTSSQESPDTVQELMPSFKQEIENEGGARGGALHPRGKTNHETKSSETPQISSVRMTSQSR